MPAPTDFSLHGYEILVIDDDPVSRLFLSRLIAKCGGRVQVAECGDDGLRLFKQSRFPLVITDICMPGMDGIELAGRIREIDPDSQIIATSANGESDERLASSKPGFNDYIVKPVEIDKLLAALQRCRDRITAAGTR